MTKVKTILQITPVILIITGLIFLFSTREKTPSSTYPLTNSRTITFNGSLFAQGLASAEKGDCPSSAGTIVGGIAPHHDLAAEMLAQFFRCLKKSQAVTTFILLGPNHADIGLGPVITSPADWELDFGTIGVNQNKLNQIINKNLAVIDEVNFQPEHSVTVYAPYLKYYFPEAKIVPLIVSSKITPAEANRLAAQIAELLNESTFLIGSLDFSHYLSNDLTAVKDAETLALIQADDQEKIWRLTNDHLDSPYTLVTFLKVMHSKSADKLTVLNHKNSADYLGYDLLNSTSYFTMYYIK